MKSNRRAFTLTELLVVITILLLLSVMAFAVFGTGKSSEKMRSGARTGQAGFLGAKDRALHAKDLRGVRLTTSAIIDYTQPPAVIREQAKALNWVNGFVYVQPLPMQSVGNVSSGISPNDMSIWRPISDATQIILTGNEGQACFTQDSNGVWPSSTLQVRIPAKTGQWYQLAKIQNTAPYWVMTDPNNQQNGTNNYWLYLQTGFPGGSAGNPTVGILNGIGTAGDTRASMDIQLGNEVLPFHAPITLPSGCVIDLYNSKIPTSWYQQSSMPQNSVPTNPAWAICGPDPANGGNVIARLYTTQMDVMFSPRGNVAGSISALGAMYFLIRDIRDVTLGLDPTLLANQGQMRGEMMILGLFPQTGLVQTFDCDLTDANNDGVADDLAGFARKGMSAGR